MTRCWEGRGAWAWSAPRPGPTRGHPDLDCGRTLSPVTIAYETYGERNEADDNAILIFHALSGDAHVAGYHSADDRRPGWWDTMVGPGKAWTQTSTM